MAVTNSFTFGLFDVKVAPRVSAGNWGTNVDVEAVQMMDVELDLETGELEGDDIIIDQHSKVQAINGNIRFGVKDLNVLATITNVTLGSYTNYEMLTFGKDDMGYFGMTGRANSTETSGDKQMFVPKVKLMQNLTLGFEKGQYQIVESAFRGIYENETYGACKIIENNTAQSVTVPPTMAS